MEPAKPSLLSNIIAGVGVFFLIIALIWGFSNIGRWAPMLFSNVGSWFSRTGTSLTISLQSATVQSGTPTTISWNHKSSDGTYAFIYECRAGLSVRVPDAAGVSTALPCATAYVVSATGPRAIKVTPVASSSASILMPFSITYRDASGVTGASATDAITVISGSSGNPATTTTPTTPSATARPDLTVHMIGLGVMLNGVYTPASVINSGDTAAIKFEIVNQGTAATGAWRFRATLPTTPAYTYDSVAQSSLAPGSKIVYTLKFTNLAQGGGVVTVTADSGQSVHESNESNNGVSYRINVLH